MCSQLGKLCEYGDVIRRNHLFIEHQGCCVQLFQAPHCRILIANFYHRDLILLSSVRFIQYLTFLLLFLEHVGRSQLPIRHLLNLTFLKTMRDNRLEMEIEPNLSGYK